MTTKRDTDLDLVRRIHAVLDIHSTNTSDEMRALEKIDESLRAADQELADKVADIMDAHAKRRVRIANAIAELNRRVSILPIPGPEPVDRGLNVYAEATEEETDALPSVLEKMPTLPQPKTTPPSLVSALKGAKK